MTALPLDREALERAVTDLRGSLPPGPILSQIIAQSRAALDLEARVAELEREKEAVDAACPEDVGPIEFIGALLSQRNRAEAALAAAEANVREARECLDAFRQNLGQKWSKELADWADALLARPASDDALRAVCEKVADNPWTTFGRLVWHWLSDRWDSSEDSYEIAEMSVAAGLAEQVPYDPEKHGEMDAEPGEDVIFFPTHGDPKPSDLVSRVLGDATKGATEGGEA